MAGPGQGKAGFVLHDSELRIGLADLKAGIADKPALLNIAGELMRASVARTFRQEGSPAGSWAKLALSTLRKKGYTSGHKLLVLTGRLFGSITYQVAGDTLTIGTALRYAAVQQFGSADRRGAAIGPQAKLPGRATKAGRHQNIPPRPFLVFRPEDPQRIVRAWERYLGGRAVRIGKMSFSQGGAA